MEPDPLATPELPPGVPAAPPLPVAQWPLVLLPAELDYLRAMGTRPSRPAGWTHTPGAEEALDAQAFHFLQSQGGPHSGRRAHRTPSVPRAPRAGVSRAARVGQWAIIAVTAAGVAGGIYLSTTISADAEVYRDLNVSLTRSIEDLK